MTGACMVPREFDELVPAFIARVPATGMGPFGRRSFHDRRQGEDDRLRFAAPAFVSCSRGARSGWRSDD